MQDKVQALVRLSEAERSNSRSSNQVDSLKKQNQDLTHRLTLATQEKVNALMQLAADGNASHAGKGSGPSPQKSSTWKVNPNLHLRLYDHKESGRKVTSGMLMQHAMCCVTLFLDTPSLAASCFVRVWPESCPHVPGEEHTVY